MNTAHAFHIDRDEDLQFSRLLRRDCGAKGADAE